MFRKRKNPTPDFRMPVPYNPVSGEYAPLGLDPPIIGKTDTDGTTARQDDTPTSGDTTPGSGTVSLYRMPRGATTITDLETEVTCFNISSGTVPGDTFVLVRQDEYGRYWIVTVLESEQKKPFCRFTLDSDLAQSDHTQDATITYQWGYGVGHDIEETITVVNHEQTDTGDMLHGDTGDYGTAIYDPDYDMWHIIQMECP